MKTRETMNRQRMWFWMAALIVSLGLLYAATGHADANEPAKEIVSASGVSHGLCCMVGGAGSELPVALAEASGLLVHVIDGDASAVQAGREAATKKGLGIKRVLIERADASPLSHADSTLDLLLVPETSKEILSKLASAEVLRALRPQGKAMFRLREGCGVSRVTLEDWAKQSSLKLTPLDKALDTWFVLAKPAISGVDDWSHWEHGPDNNPVSTDTVIKAPYMTQWMAEPYYIAMPAITTAAGGRTFVAMGHIAHHEREEAWLNTLLARNGYNGAELWRKRLPDGYLVHRSAFIATDDVFYMIDPGGQGCLLLNPETGDEAGRVRVPEVRGEWKWIAMAGGTLFGLAGEKNDPPQTTLVRSKYPAWSWGELSKGYYEQPQIPWGFGETVFAYD
ncbi:MAG: class I SAM-dependent methyltransferase, partial [Candidatus Hydrogenedentes bacterium]|nr:class I SAM-dependent methyltransferase [Candidatus Hydrogenedentota bacterium]